MSTLTRSSLIVLIRLLIRWATAGLPRPRAVPSCGWQSMQLLLVNRLVMQQQVYQDRVVPLFSESLSARG